MTADAGSVVTVEGRIDPTELGTTITHEHVFIDLIEPWYDPPEAPEERELAEAPVSLENLWYIRKNQLGNRDNGRLDSLEDAVAELDRFRRAGGRTVVDVTPKNLGGDPERVRAVGRETDLQIVHGTAQYTRPAHEPHVADASIRTLADEFVRDVREGIDGTDVRAGIVGELGTSGHIHDDEEKVLRAGARAALETGAPVSIHPTGRNREDHEDYTYPTSRWAHDILDILESEGLPPERVIMSHLDRARLEFEPESLDHQLDLADRGAFIEYDLWGNEMYHDGYDKKPSDAERADAVKTVLEAGHGDRLLFSHDVCLKVQLTRYGGFGYGHLLETIAPMLRHNGVTQSAIDAILMDNPRTALTFEEPA